MKFDLYFWPIREQAWVLSWGLLHVMQNMGILNRYGNINNWTNPNAIGDLLNTRADVILFVGLEHFRGKIPIKRLGNVKPKMVAWTYESLTDPYGAEAWGIKCPNNFLSSKSDFMTGFTKVNDSDLEFFDFLDVIFCADELDYDRFKKLGKQSFWLPFGVDSDIFSPDPRLLISEKNVKETSTTDNKIRYGTRYGVRSGRAKQIRDAAMAVRSSKLMPGKRFYPSGCFIGTISNVRAAILNRLGLDLVAYQTPRKGAFDNEHIAAQHTKELAKAYNGFLISFNLRSIFSGVTPRATESMSCARLLFQYNCPPNRPLSQGMLKNCIKYDIMTDHGLREVREKYKYYIAHVNEAMDIGTKARAEVLQGHTLKHRVQHLLAKLSCTKKDTGSIRVAMNTKACKEEEEKAIPEASRSDV